MSVHATLVLVNEAAANVTFSAAAGSLGTSQEYLDLNGPVLAARDMVRFTAEPTTVKGRYRLGLLIRVFFPVIVGSSTVYKFCEFTGGRFTIPGDTPIAARQRLRSYLKSVTAHAAMNDFIDQIQPPRGA